MGVADKGMAGWVCEKQEGSDQLDKTNGDKQTGLSRDCDKLPVNILSSTGVVGQTSPPSKGRLDIVFVAAWIKHFHKALSLKLV